MQIIQLCDSTGNNVLDSVSAEYEDSFCLETFGDLIAAHRNSEPKGTKSFIIARVQTWDHKQPDKAFYSYYNAFHLNKTLFQTQVYLGKKLIHRLNVLNPLSNTDIIGNVQYFMVKSFQPSANSSPSSSRSASQKSNASLDAAPLQTQRRVSGIGALQAKSLKSKGSKVPKITIIPGSIANSEVIPPSPSVQAIEKGDPGSWTIATPTCKAIVEHDEEEGPANPKNTPQTLLIPTPINQQPRPFSFLAKSWSAPPSNQVSPTQLENGPSVTVNAVVSPTQIETHLHESALRVPIREGAVTRFSQQIDDLSDIPKTGKGRRRILSYHNAVNASGSPASIEDWMKMVSQEKESAAENGDYDKVQNLGSEDDDYLPDIETIYTAILFATDDDFLEQARIRKVFRENAVAVEEAKLFEMTPVTSEPPSSPNSNLHPPIDYEESTACDWCFPTVDQLAKYSPIVRFLHQFKFYGLVIIIIVLIIIFIVFSLKISVSDYGSLQSVPSPISPSLFSNVKTTSKK